MKEWEIIFYLELSWQVFSKGQVLDEGIKSIVKAISFQNIETRKAAMQKIASNSKSSEEFIRHCERLLNVKYAGQMRLKLCM